MTSLFLNALLARILIKDRKQLAKSSFYPLTWPLIAGDVLTQTMQLIIAVPITYSGSPIYGTGALMHVLAAFDTFAYTTTMFFTLLMSINRIAVFLFATANAFLFDAATVFRTIALWWLLPLVVTVGLNVVGCWKSFHVEGFYLSQDCGTALSQNVYGVFYDFNSFAPVAILVMYVVLFAYIHYIHKVPLNDAGARRNKRQRELRLLLQSFLICASLEIQNQAFNVFPKLGATGQWFYVVNFATNWISILNSTMTPIVLFIFNNQMRSHLRAMLSGKNSLSTSEATNSSQDVRLRRASRSNTIIPII